MYIDMQLLRGQVLINEGDASDCLYFLKSGELAIYKFDKKTARNNLIGYVEPDEIFGEMSFLNNLPRSASVKANTDCEIAIINRGDFNKIFATQDPLMQTLVKTLSERLHKANSKL
jgi:CRP-like cAMP-binding protein